MTMIVTINADGPRDPLYVLELAEGLAEIVRALNHLTRDPVALAHPSEVDTLVRYLAEAAGRVPQLLEQVQRRLTGMQTAGEVRAVAGEYEGRPVVAVAAAGVRLGAAITAAGELREALDDVAALTRDLGGDEA